MKGLGVHKLLHQAGRLTFDNRAAATIEYALVAVLIGIGSVAALTAMADSIIRIWSDVEDEVTESISSVQEKEASAANFNLGSFNKTKKNKGKSRGKGKGKKPQG